MAGLKGRVCSLDFQVTWPHTIGLLPTGYMKSSTYSLSTTLKWQQDPPGTSMIFLRPHVNFFCLNFGFEMKPIISRLNICSKLVRTANFFRILQSFCLTCILSQIHFCSHRICNDARPTYICLAIDLCFVSPIASRSFDMEIFRTLYSINKTFLNAFRRRVDLNTRLSCTTSLTLICRISVVTEKECISTWLAVNEKLCQLYLYVYYWDLFSRNFHSAEVSLGFFGVIHSSRF
jgi:hypothetical protein